MPPGYHVIGAMPLGPLSLFHSAPLTADFVGLSLFLVGLFEDARVILP